MNRLSLTILMSGAAMMAVAQTTKKMSLYDELGGIHKIADYVDRCVDMSSKDPILLANPKFKMLSEQFGGPALKFILTNTVAAGTGGPQKMAFKDFFSVMRWMELTPAQLEHLMENERMVMAQAKIDPMAGKKVQDWFFSQAMKANAKAPMPESFMDPKSLYARLGGFGPIAMVCDTFIDEIGRDPVVTENPHVVKAKTDGHISDAGLFYLVTELMLMSTGGPFTYSGRSMKESHMGLMINDREWDAGAKLFVRVLDMYKVGEREKKELLGAIAATKKDIVSSKSGGG